MTEFEPVRPPVQVNVIALRPHRSHPDLQLLPVDMELRGVDEVPTTAMIMVIDHSGSIVKTDHSHIIGTPHLIHRALRRRNRQIQIGHARDFFRILKLM